LNKSARPHLLLIEQALNQIDLYRPTSEAAFLADEKGQDAIFMRLQQIGENLIKIREQDPEAFQHQPDSWHKLAGPRNVISHSYETIEPDTIWIIVDRHLQPFRVTIESALADLLED
jgi:uncharacterized protein with HEPN domain